MTSLLSISAFLEVLSQLVGVAKEGGVAQSMDVKEKSLEMICSKLEDKKTRFTRAHVIRSIAVNTCNFHIIIMYRIPCY